MTSKSMLKRHAAQGDERAKATMLAAEIEEIGSVGLDEDEDALIVKALRAYAARAISER